MNEAPHPHEDPTRTTPIGLARYAAEFLEAALAADDKMGLKPRYEIVAPVPVMFLVGQSIELSLKSYLLFKGESLRRLKMHYGHDLHRALRKAKEYGLLKEVPLSQNDVDIIKVLDPLYSTKQLQYIVCGAKTFPAFGPLEMAARKLSEGVSLVVGHNPRRAPNAD